MHRGVFVRGATGTLVAVLLAAGQPGLASATPAGSHGTGNPAQVVDASAAGFTFQGEELLESGSSIVTYRKGGAVIKGLGEPGSTIEIEPRADGQILSAGVITKVDKESQKGEPVKAGSKSAAVKDLQRFGLSDAEIRSHFPHLLKEEEPSTVTSRPWGSPVLASVSGPTRRSDLPTSNDMVDYNPPLFKQLQCVNFDNRNTPRTTFGYVMSGCSEIYWVRRDVSTGDWYMLVRYTGWEYAPGTYISKFGLENVWSTEGGGNQTYNAAPSGPITIPSGTCTSMTMTINSPWGVGFSVSSNNICADYVKPWNLSRYIGGAQWNGYSMNEYRNVEGGFALHSPPGSGGTYSTKYFLGW